VRGADRVAVAALAEDMGAGVLGDRFVAGQEGRAARREAGEDRRAQ
jgi:hypothetical protein